MCGNIIKFFPNTLIEFCMDTRCSVSMKIKTKGEDTRGILLYLNASTQQESTILHGWTQLKQPWFVQHLVYSVTHSVVPTNSSQVMWFSVLPSMTNITASTSDRLTMPIICSNIIFQEVDYFENSTTSLSLRRQTLFSFR